MIDSANKELDKQQLRELLPFQANQTLEPAQQEQVQSGLKRYPELQPELAWLQAMRQTVQEQPLDPTPAGDLGWSIVARRIASAGAPKATPSARAAPSWREKLRVWLQLNFMPVMATACAVLVVQAVVIGSLLKQDATYTAAGSPDPVATNARGVLLHVTVRPNVTEPQLRETLLRFKASIVQGPTALGLYTLRMEPTSDEGESPVNAARLSQRLQRDAPGVFESVTPAEGP